MGGEEATLPWARLAKDDRVLFDTAPRGPVTCKVCELLRFDIMTRSLSSRGKLGEMDTEYKMVGEDRRRKTGLHRCECFEIQHFDLETHRPHRDWQETVHSYVIVRTLLSSI